MIEAESNLKCSKSQFMYSRNKCDNLKLGGQKHQRQVSKEIMANEKKQNK